MAPRHTEEKAYFCGPPWWKCYLCGWYLKKWDNKKPDKPQQGKDTPVQPDQSQQGPDQSQQGTTSQKDDHYHLLK